MYNISPNQCLENGSFFNHYFFLFVLSLIFIILYLLWMYVLRVCFCFVFLYVLLFYLLGAWGLWCLGVCIKNTWSEHNLLPQCICCVCFGHPSLLWYILIVCAYTLAI